MKLIWSYDLAREQSPTMDVWRQLCRTSLDAGYDAMAIYLEHRFAYDSAPWLWSDGGPDEGVLTPAIVKSLRREFPDLQLIPMVNLLGHMEGFFGTHGGSWLAEERFKGLSGCPSKDGFAEFCAGLLDDVLAAFDSEWIHLGGDETSQLGNCPQCAARVEEVGKAGLYASHFFPLIEKVKAAGRRPCLWADMALAEPGLLELLPRDVLMFDWQYFGSFTDSAKTLHEAGFEMVLCPTVQAYNAPWVHLGPTSQNIEDAFASAEEPGVLGLCLTTWEAGLFGSYETLMPLIAEFPMGPGWLGRVLDGGLELATWSRLMGIDLPSCGEPFAHSDHRSRLKCHLLLYGDPFLLWRKQGDALVSKEGQQAFEIAEQAVGLSPTPSHRGVAVFVATAIRFTEMADKAYQAYAAGRPGEAAVALVPARALFDGLQSSARASYLNFGGSRADIERCRIAKEHVERVIRRIKEYGDGSLGYLPAFEAITHPNFVPFDQGNWWNVNRWGLE